MRIDIRGRGITVTRELHDYIRRRLGFAFDRFADRIAWIFVWVRNANTRNDDLATVCRMAIRLKQSKLLVLENRASEPRTAIDRAAQRAACSVRNEVNRKYDLHHVMRRLLLPM